MNDCLLANAALLDPATGRETPGAVLIRDGRIAGIAHGAAPGAPGKREKNRLRRAGARAGPDRHACLRRRARCGTPRDPGVGECGGGGRRRHDAGLHAGHQSGDRRSGDRRFRPAARPRHRLRQRPAGGRDHQGPRGARDDRVRPAQGGRRRGLHRRPACRRQRSGDAPCADLRPRFRCAGDAACRGCRSRRRGRDERGRTPPRASA